MPYMTKQKERAVLRLDHPAAAVVAAFGEMREKCRHYRGIKLKEDSLQCTHPDMERHENWCAMDVCPLLRERAQVESLGWDN